jgi:hypothetical protein
MPKIFRSLEVQSLNVGNTDSVLTQEIPKTVYWGILLDINVTHTNSSGTVVVDQDTFGKYIDLQLSIDGDLIPVRINVRDLFYINKYLFKNNPKTSFFTTASTAGTSHMRLILPFSIIGGEVFEDGLLDTRGAGSVSLMMTTKSASVFGSNVSAIDSGVAYVQTLEYANVPVIANQFARTEYAFVEHTLTSTGVVRYSLPYGGDQQYRGLLVQTETSSALSNSVLNTMRVTSRSFDYLNSRVDFIQQKNELETGHSSTGNYFIDFTSGSGHLERQKMTERLDARALTELFLEVDSAVSSGTVRVITIKELYGG